MAAKIDKVTIAVKNMDAMAAFYTKALGAELKKIGPTVTGRLGDVKLLLCPREIAGVTAEQNTIQLRFVVRDLAKTMTAALDAGGEKIDDVSVRDPDGNSIEFAEE